MLGVTTLALLEMVRILVKQSVIKIKGDYPHNGRAEAPLFLKIQIDFVSGHYKKQSPKCKLNVVFKTYMVQS